MDFLSERGHAIIRKEINNITDSYHHYWDILSEIFQNSCDSLKRIDSGNNDNTGKYILNIDAVSRTIKLYDNGTGIFFEHIKPLLTPGGTDKSDKNSEVGEKGVGLTFCLFSTNSFKLVSKDKNGKIYKASVENANKWLQGDTDEMPNLVISEEVKNTDFSFNDHEPHLYSESFCEITLASIIQRDEEIDLFNLDFKQLMFCLKTKTALGDTRSIWDSDFTNSNQCDYIIKIKDGSIYEGSVDAGYPIPHTWMGTNFISLSEVVERFSTARDERSKKRILSKKAIYNIQDITISSRNVKLYSVMFPGHSIFKKLNTDTLDVCSTTSYDADPSNAFFSPSIQLSTKSIPTGVSLERPTKGGKVGYYQRCFFLLEDDRLSFDLV